MQPFKVGSIALVGLVAAGMTVACSGDFPTDVRPTAVGVVQAIDFALLPDSRTCPAVTPVTFGGPGIPATFAFVFKMNVLNTKTHDVTIEKIESNGLVTGAPNDVGIGHTANVGAASTIDAARLVPAGQTIAVSGSFSFPCGLSPDVLRATYWDISTRLTITTSDGAIQTGPVVFRRSWNACGLDVGHPCPVTQPALPTN